MQVTSKQGQWLGDVAVREAGSIEAVVEMAIENDVAITGIISAGTTHKQPASADKRVMNYYKINNIHPATSMEAKSSFKGIGYMAIGSTFKVQ